MLSIVKPVLPLTFVATAIGTLLCLGYREQVIYILILVFVSAMSGKKFHGRGLVRRWRDSHATHAGTHQEPGA
jgi:hypothetical protein